MKSRAMQVLLALIVVAAIVSTGAFYVVNEGAGRNHGCHYYQGKQYQHCFTFHFTFLSLSGDQAGERVPSGLRQSRIFHLPC